MPAGVPGTLRRVPRLDDRIFAVDRLAAVRRTRLLDTGPEEPFDRLARLARQLLDVPFAFITVVDERRSFWKSCIGVDATDPADRQNLVEESFCQYVIATDAPVIIDDARLNPMTSGNPSIEAMGVISWAGFPVRSPDGVVLGTFCVLDHKPRHWTTRDAEILEVAAYAAAGEIALRTSLDDAVLAAEQAASALALAATFASTLQESLLPPHLPSIEGLDVAASYVAGGTGVEVLGDFYDVVPAPGGWSVFVGDVCGKGAQAARTTALARYTLRASALRHASPAVVLTELHKALLGWFEDTQTTGFVTVGYANVRRQDDGFKVRVCTAGHPPALLRRADGTVVAVGATSTLLGATSRISLAIDERILRPGDSLILYSDGVTEARARDTGDFLGLEAFQRILTETKADSAALLVKDLQRRVLDFTAGTIGDDIAIVAMQVPPAYS